MSESSEKVEADFMNSVMSFDFHDANIVHDRVLIVDGQKFYVQAGFLVIWSDYFRALFTSEFQEKNDNEIELKDLSAEEFNVFLQVIYPGDYNIRANDITSLIVLSYRFMAPNVLNLCKKFVDKEFSKINKIKLLEVAVAHGINSLKTNALNHIKTNVKSLNLIQLLKLAFDLDLDELKKCLRDLINNPGFKRYRCDSCPNGIQLVTCTHITEFRHPIKCISLLADHKEEILQLPAEIQSFVLDSLISGT